MIDTHCHLNMPPLVDDLIGVMERAAASGVDQVIVPAYDLESWPAVLGLNAEIGSYPKNHRECQRIFSALGIHPWVAHEMAPVDFPGVWKKVLAQGQTPVVAVGEIGLDTKVGQPDLKAQLDLLEVQLQTAVDEDLPVILHCRGAFAELLAAINNHGGRLRGVLHAFSRSIEVAEQFLKAGMHLGLGGAITRPRARRVRQAVAHLPLERIVLETDAPSIGLDGVPPGEIEPRHVAQVAVELGRLRQLPVSEVALATTNNARYLFGLNSGE